MAITRFGGFSDPGGGLNSGAARTSWKYFCALVIAYEALGALDDLGGELPRRAS
jgi:hypothetical protein